ncbi:MlaE family ABC transporter permease [Desulfovermiculus halophilus]|uniref:MlaE family ABC transporter permease n=1 Tax=Desulfovermiculus halophilus TaxID=339722 RepID=UPI000555A5B1|nr:ABC transporter permease [Desulfovermiculus halophilus]
MDKVSINPLGGVSALGRAIIHLIQELGAVFVFFLSGVRHILAWPPEVSKAVHQVYFIGVKSVFVILLVGLFTGMVLGLQLYYTLVKFGSEGVLGAGVALSIIRELGPVLTAIMIIGRAGSAMAAEIGIMRITEQIDALFTMDINPIRYLISPRILASLISFPLLTALFDVVGIIGGYLTGVILLGINPGVFFSRMESLVVVADVTGGFVKALFFGIIVVTICCYQGFYVHQRAGGHGAKGVSLATTSAVVLSSVAVLISDYVLTSFLL